MPELPKKYQGPTRTKRVLTNAQRKHRSENAQLRQEGRMLRTGSTRWRRIREAILSKHPMCAICLEEGKGEPAIDVDHIDGDTFNNRLDNLQGLCRKHHAQKTAAETPRGKSGRFKRAQNT